MYFNGVNDLKTGVRIFRMIQEVSVLQSLKMQTQSQMSMMGGMRSLIDTQKVVG
jgi:hypothetical protein